MTYQCRRPIELRDRGFRRQFSCGVCKPCLIKRQMAWVFRMTLERRTRPFGSFLTLTYSDKNCPMRLDKRDITLFLKRYRKSIDCSVRYFYVGEYGTNTKRPHWHVIFCQTMPCQIPKGLSSIPTWQDGGVYKGDVTPQSMGYVARYALKNANQREYKAVVGMSRMPGLGTAGMEDIARHVFTQRSEIPNVPYLATVGKSRYPIDFTMRKVFENAYLQAGGAIADEKVSSMQAHLRSVYALHVEEEVNYEAEAREKWSAEIREIERGTQ